MVSDTVTVCGKAWDKCYTEEEVLASHKSKQLFIDMFLFQVQRLQDMHLESLLAQHSSLSLSGCSLVEEYLESGRREGNMDQDARCSDRRSIQGQQKFQVCQALLSICICQSLENVLLFAFIFGGISCFWCFFHCCCSPCLFH